MFYTAEDVNPAVTAATNIFGEVGTMNHEDSVFRNQSIATREFGKLWYGDIEVTTAEAKCLMLSKAIGQKVYMLPQDSWDFEKHG